MEEASEKISGEGKSKNESPEEINFETVAYP
jgi:hypothetical protein